MDDQIDSFTELNTQSRTDASSMKRKGNIIKASDMKGDPLQTEQSSQNQEPQVIIHRNGEQVESIEFRCSCGKHAEIRVEYDGD